MFPRLGLFILVHVSGACQTVNALDVVGRLDIRLFELHLDETACEGHHTDVVTRTGFNSYHITFLQFELIDVMVIAFACVFKLHLDQVGEFRISRHVSQPVVGVQLAVLAAHGFMSQTTVAAATHRSILVLFFHITSVF